jgi:hypothetical protein
LKNGQNSTPFRVNKIFSLKFYRISDTLGGSLMELVSYKLPIKNFKKKAGCPLGSKRAQWRPLVAKGHGALLKMPSRSTNNSSKSTSGQHNLILVSHSLSKCMDGFINSNYGKRRLDRPITISWIVQADLVGPIEITLI